MARQPGLDDRHRDENGQTREKNSNTRIDTLRDIDGPDFAPGLHGDAHLGTLSTVPAATRCPTTCGTGRSSR